MSIPAPRHTLYDWFAASAAAHPDHPALEIGATELTYAALTGLADALAARLIRHLDGRPPHRVGLLAGRTVVAYAGYLAIQRLGATAVPLGPSFPAERNAGIVRAARLDAVLTDGTAEHPAPRPGAPVLALTDPELLRLTAPPLPDIRTARPDDLAYLLFTSGSTGTPKGVPVQHRNICAYLTHVVPRCGASPGARLSQTFDLTFDPSVHDMFTAWGSGATLVVPTRDDLLAPVRFVNRRALTHWNSVPSVISLAQRFRALRPGSMPTLRSSMFCGEPLTLQQAGAWQRAAPQSRLENAYGPTELTVTCASYRLPGDPADWPAPANGTVPIGTLYPGLELLLHEGELCVRGPQRFPGYLDPANNTGRFLAPDGTPYDPATALTGDHWYRTGDRVRPLPAPGDPAGGPPLVHLGRGDQQVQVHGYRVELGEVEAALRALPGVLDAAVLPRATPGGLELTAAYTGTPGTEDDLRTALRGRLPAYMVPAHLTALAVLPLNGNGKVDRAALGDLLGPS
ncbi:AMP-binding protein [Streptomyces sp. NPDC002446]